MSGIIPQLLGELEREHGQVREALSALNGFMETGDVAGLRSALSSWATVLCAGLDEHSQREDVTVFPPAAEAVGSEIIAAFMAEHVRILAGRDRLYASQSDADVFAECLDLTSLLESHMEREETVLFPSIRDIFEEVD